MSCIYCLYSTADFRPRYVGQTTKSAASRLERHRRDAWRRDGTAALHRWIRRVEAQGFEVAVHVLQHKIAPRDLTNFERYWMGQFRGLLNRRPAPPVVPDGSSVGVAIAHGLARTRGGVGQKLALLWRRGHNPRAVEENPS